MMTFAVRSPGYYFTVWLLITDEREEFMFWQLEHQMVLGIERMAPGGGWMVGLLPCFLSSSSPNHQLVFFRNEQRFEYNRPRICKYQCSGSMTFWCGYESGFADPCLWLIDPDPDADPAIFLHLPSRRQQKINLKKVFSPSYFLYIHLHHFSKIKSSKDATKQ